MYEEFFGLSRSPFKITPDTSLFYDGGRRGDVLGALLYAVQRGEGIVKVVGEVGSGKTMLCRMLQKELPSSVEIIYISNPSISATDILFVIAQELCLPVDRETSKHQVMHLLQDYLLKAFAQSCQVVLFVEEAQSMPLETLEEIRLLSNLETDQDKLLQIILFGQPELDENLRTGSIRQLKERITHEFNLTPLTDDEIYKYLNFRMREVGYTGPELIDSSIAKVIGRYSGGLLRRINIIADKVLLSAFAESTHDISAKHVKAAVKDSGFERSIDGKEIDSKLVYYIILAIVIGVTVFFSIQFFNVSQVVVSVEAIEPAKIQQQEQPPAANQPKRVNQEIEEKPLLAQPEKTVASLIIKDVDEQKSLLEPEEDSLATVISRKKRAQKV